MPIIDVVILGGGPIGIFASSLAKIKGLNPILIEASSSLGGQPYSLYAQKEIVDLPGFSTIKSYQFIDKLIDQFNKNNIPFHLNCSISAFKLNEDNTYSVQLSNNSLITTKNIIIATGVGKIVHKQLEVAQTGNNCIQYNVLNIDSYKSKKVIILGGGDSAVDWANTICQIASSTTIIHRRSEFRAHGHNVDLLAKQNVNVLLNKTISKVDNSVVYFVDNTTQEINLLPFDILIVQYGQTIDKNSLNVFSSIKTVQERIIVDCSQLSNLPNIYAVGDVCIYDGKPRSLVCGFGEASVAVRDIINKIRKYE